jgi:hypothetical protein
MVDELNTKLPLSHAAAEKSGAELSEEGAAPHSERDRWLVAMADQHCEFDRRYSSLSRRLDRLEGTRGMFSRMDDELKAMLLMVGISVFAPILIDLGLELYKSWRQRLSSS